MRSTRTSTSTTELRYSIDKKTSKGYGIDNETKVKYKETTRNTEGKSELGGARGETRQPDPEIPQTKKKKLFGEICGVAYAAADTQQYVICLTCIRNVCTMSYVHTYARMPGVCGRGLD